MSAPTSNRRLKIPTCNHSLAFRRIEAVIRNDRNCRLVFGDRIRAWNGEALDVAPWAINLTPGITLTPGQSSDEWYGPSGFKSNLTIDCEIGVPGTNVEDIFDVLQVVRRAFYPTNTTDSQTIHNTIAGPAVSGGLRICETGEPIIGSPGISIISAQADAITLARFGITLEVQDTINP